MDKTFTTNSAKDFQQNKNMYFNNFKFKGNPKRRKREQTTSQSIKKSIILIGLSSQGAKKIGSLKKIAMQGIEGKLSDCLEWHNKTELIFT